MTPKEAQRFVDQGRAWMGADGWWIAHEIRGKLEWFRVNEADNSVFDSLTGVKLGS